MILRELLTILGFEVNDKELKAYDAGIVDLKKNLLLVTAAAGAAAAAIFGVVKSSAEYGNKLDKTIDLTGLSAQQLQELRGAASLADVDLQGFNQSMVLFSRNISQAAQGQGMGIKAFQMMGISVFDTSQKLKSNAELLNEVANGMKNISNKQVLADIAMQLFGRSGASMINMLKGGSAEIKAMIEAFRKFGFELTEKQIKASAKFEDQLTMVGFAVKGLKNAVGQELLPAVSQMVEQFLKWIAANKKVVEQNLVQIFKGIATFVKIVTTLLMTLIGVIGELTKVFGGWGRVLRVVVALLALIVSSKIITGFAKLIKSVFLLGGAFKKLATIEGIADALGLLLPAIGIGVLLLLDDIKNFLEGNNSLIGELMKKFPRLGAVISFIGKAIRFVGHWAAEPFILLWDIIRDIFKLCEKAISKFSTLPSIIKGVPSHLMGALTGLPFSGLAPVAATSKGSNIINHVNTNVTLTVPQGSTAEQQRFLHKAAQKTFHQSMQDHLDGVLARNPVTE